MQKITPFLWFDTQAEEAVNFYVSLFKNSRITHTVRYDEAGAQASGRPVGSVMTIGFELNGQEFAAINGGPIFKFTEAISFSVNCADQAEIDDLWEKLTADGGKPSQCGWLKDKFGLSWQIVPANLGELIANPRAMQAMMSMQKINVAVLEAAGKI